MNAYLFGAGDLFLPPQMPKETDLVIAVDGGVDHVLSLSLTPHLLIGDFDSGALPRDLSCPVIRYPVEKDETDMQLAISFALRRGAKTVFLLGGTGGRDDHFLANLACLAHLAHLGRQAFLVGKNTVFTALKSGTFSLSALPFPLIEGNAAVFAFGSDAKGVTIRGFRYECEDITLFSHIPTGVSNHYDGRANAEISVKDGVLLVMLPIANAQMT